MPAILHSGCQIMATYLQGWEQSNGKRNEQGHRKTGRNQPPVQNGHLKTWDRLQRGQRFQSPEPDDRSSGQAQEGQKKALRKQMPNNSPTTRTQRNADTQLTNLRQRS